MSEFPVLSRRNPLQPNSRRHLPSPKGHLPRPLQRNHRPSMRRSSLYGPQATVPRNPEATRSHCERRGAPDSPLTRGAAARTRRADSRRWASASASRSTRSGAWSSATSSRGARRSARGCSRSATRSGTWTAATCAACPRSRHVRDVLPGCPRREGHAAHVPLGVPLGEGGVRSVSLKHDFRLIWSYS